MDPWKPPSLGTYVKQLKYRSLESVRAELREIQIAINDIKWERRHEYEYDFMEFYVLKSKQSLLITMIQEHEYELKQANIM